MKYQLLRTVWLTLAFITTNVFTQAAIPSGYYNSCEGKKGQELLTALYQTIGSHTDVSYSGLWSLYKTSDVDSNGKIWDIYSTKRWTYSSEQCGTYSVIGDCYNREHSFPKSWFNDKSPMYSDAFHIYPTDGKVNNQRGNYPYGECANGSSIASSNGVSALGKLGTCTFSGYTGTVFEPDDQYKGDLARSYFYMIACYNNQVSGWTSEMLNGTSYPAFSDWALNLLLKWHREDPVSEKETNRNEAIYAAQKNRNPFIDYPELVEYIWGNKTTSNWSSTLNADPSIATPVDGSTIDMGTTAIGVTKTYSITVKGINLDQNVSISLSGQGFSCIPSSSIAASTANSEAGGAIIVKYNSSTVGSATATLTLTSGDAKSTVTIKANAIDGLPVNAPSDITEDSFTANWVYIGDATDGNYSINLYQSGQLLQGYPIAVTATTGKYTITNLTPETTYTYTVSSASKTSETVTVTTATPIPSIQFLYDGELSFVATQGTPSEVAEIIAEIENISNDITISVASPFQVSTDKSNWSTSITLDPEEDRFYMRLYGDTPGKYTTDITANAGSFNYESAEIEGTITSNEYFLETFETTDLPSGYCTTLTSYTGTATTWNLLNFGVFAQNAYEGEVAGRGNKKAGGYIATATPLTQGVGTLSFYAESWGSKEVATINVDYSTDNGSSWVTAKSIEISNYDGFSKYDVAINQKGSVMLRIIQPTTAARYTIDNISATRYGDESAITSPTADYHQWDAFSRDSQLVIQSSFNGKVKAGVYGADGRTYFNGKISQGETTLPLAGGLYIVVINDFSRRVVVK
jgi:endonuclease I